MNNPTFTSWIPALIDGKKYGILNHHIHAATQIPQTTFNRWLFKWFFTKSVFWVISDAFMSKLMYAIEKLYTLIDNKMVNSVVPRKSFGADEDVLNWDITRIDYQLFRSEWQNHIQILYILYQHCFRAICKMSWWLTSRKCNIGNWL